MAKVTHVKKAQQRYATVPVIDPETGQQKRTPVMRRGEQKTDKRGRPVFMNVTRADKTQPLPNRKCEKCGVEIKVGDPYKHVTPKSGMFGGTTRFRCEPCPTWQPWELSSSLSARVAQIQHDYEQAMNGAESPEDVETALNDAAEAVKEIAEEKAESASNIMDGFGHETEKSSELSEIAESLHEWASEIESAAMEVQGFEEEEDCEQCSGEGEIEDICIDCEGAGQWTDDESETDETECENCEGTGKVAQDCEECSGTGKVEADFAEWLDENQPTVMDDCPV